MSERGFLKDLGPQTPGLVRIKTCNGAVLVGSRWEETLSNQSPGIFFHVCQRPSPWIRLCQGWRISQTWTASPAAAPTQMKQLLLPVAVDNDIYTDRNDTNKCMFWTQRVLCGGK